MVVVDWSEVADSINYFYAKDGVQSVGKFFGDFINDLSTTYNLSLSKISIAGHSLGAHIAGVAGKSLNGEIDHITGLDPAAPFIDGSDESYTLNKGDAKFVQVIHTSGGKLGIGQAIGHADYYPNGGSDQSGCILDLAGSCAHQRSFEYFAESIKNGTFLAERCLNFVEYYSGACNGEKSLMGGYYVDKRASGNYYLKTNDQSPFAMTEVE
ncbi:hypothetical protein NQ317_012914 [Molorchus minor]|uniref:Lipase domain-containing protein n=1 Tax=Molorchus minor TaxID=1323400 RepID=A0ABQ9JBG8_9CUCU|nr:hypothetical protein NQ317_012914 [Molorchus minor]